jgi:hypothetical protein
MGVSCCFDGSNYIFAPQCRNGLIFVLPFHTFAKSSSGVKLTITVKSTLFLLVLSVFLTSCEGILNLDLIGDGSRIVQKRSGLIFNEVELASSFILEIYQSERNELFVEADANLLPYIQTTLNRDRLEIRRKDNFNLISRKPIRIKMYTTGFRHLEISDGGTVIIDSMSLDQFSIRSFGVSRLIADKLHIDDLICLSEGGAFTKLTGSFNRFELRQIGSGETIVEGFVDEASLVQEGSGSLDAYNFEIRKATVSLFGSGLIYCNVLDHLNAFIKGRGRVYYIGMPFLESSIEGGGQLIRE